jgi:hypothetical protein
MPEVLRNQDVSDSRNLQLAICAKRTLDIVLQGRARNEHLERCVEAGQCLVELALAILQAMRLVNHERLPLDLAQLILVLEDILIRRQEHVELDLSGNLPEFKVPDHLARRRIANVGDHVHVRCPVLELRLPRRKCGQRDNNEERSILVMSMHQV